MGIAEAEKEDLWSKWSLGITLKHKGMVNIGTVDNKPMTLPKIPKTSLSTKLLHFFRLNFTLLPPTAVTNQAPILLL